MNDAFNLDDAPDLDDPSDNIFTDMPHVTEQERQGASLTLTLTELEVAKGSKAPDCHYEFWSHEYEVDLRTRCGCAECTKWLVEKGAKCRA